MIINFHPKELESKKGVEVITKLNEGGTHTVFHATEKTKEEWQEIISSDEKLILVTPTYWWGPSYEFDKWAMSVLSYGFAYMYDNGMPVGLLKGREFEMYITHGTPEAHATIMRENMKARLEKGIFGFCDSKVNIIFHDLA